MNHASDYGYSIQGQLPSTEPPGQRIVTRLSEAERLLSESLTAWEGEEDSVREEHAELIAELGEFLGSRAEGPIPILGPGEGLDMAPGDLVGDVADPMDALRQIIGTEPEDLQADNSPVPDLDVKTLLALLVDGKTFKVMEGRDFDGWAGATPGSVISYTVPEHENWTFIVGPPEFGRDGNIWIYAQYVADDGTTESWGYLTESGWEMV